MAAHGEFSTDQFGSGGEDLKIGRPVRSQVLNFETRFIRSRLKDAMEVDIAPRLLLLHSAAAGLSPDKRPTRSEIEQLATLAIGRDEAAAIAHFESVHAQEHSFASLLAYFVAPAAQHLNELWKQDLCDLFDVAVGEIRLQAIMDRFASTGSPPTANSHHRAVLVAPPGETQVFGIKVVERFLEASGWDVTFERPRQAEDVANAVAEEWVAVVGVTVSAFARLEMAARTIARIRRDSMNRGVGVMVGGSLFAENPRLVVQVGADAAWLDAPTAAATATRLLDRQATPISSQEAIPLLSCQATAAS
jgi:MerR family transcriptional regulator, light-induced transcriptional regulator